MLIYGNIFNPISNIINAIIDINIGVIKPQSNPFIKRPIAFEGLNLRKFKKMIHDVIKIMIVKIGHNAYRKRTKTDICSSRMTLNEAMLDTIDNIIIIPTESPKVKLPL